MTALWANSDFPRGERLPGDLIQHDPDIHGESPIRIDYDRLRSISAIRMLLGA
jgi:hypothetical protein